MRYLNKIIFLNSAHVPYAEVKLDGNVHFIGTQGFLSNSSIRTEVSFKILEGPPNSFEFTSNRTKLYTYIQSILPLMLR